MDLNSLFALEMGKSGPDFVGVYMDVEANIGGKVSPKMDGEFSWKTLMNKWMIWGYYYFWKHLYTPLKINMEHNHGGLVQIIFLSNG